MTSYLAGGLEPRYAQDTEFYDHSRAKVLADTYYKMGMDLYEEVVALLSTEGNRTENIWRLWPAFINLSFSCEIVLKLFYENDNGKMARGHKLYDELFDKLSEDSKKIISDMTIGYMKANGFADYVYANFCDDFQKSENTFASERYVFEVVPGKKHSLECSFLLALSKTLNILSSNLK